MNYKRILLSGLGSLYCFIAKAQGSPNLAPEASGVWNTTVKPLFPYVIAISFVIGALFNLGKIQSKEDRDVKGFVVGILWFIGGALGIMALVTWLLTLSF